MQTQHDQLPDNLGQLVDTWEKLNRQLNILIGVLAAVGFGCLGFALCLMRCSP